MWSMLEGGLGGSIERIRTSFNRAAVLEQLRSRDLRMTTSRLRSNMMPSFPARFMFIGAMNPCPFTPQLNMS
jgi:predicted ATPase with chaperone activity